MEQKNTFIPLTERRRPTVFAAAGLVLIAALGLWVGTLLSLALNPESAAMQELLTAVIYYLPFVLLPPILYGFKHWGLSDGLRLNPMPLLPTLTVILLALMCVYAASAIDSLWVLLLGALGLSEPGSSVAASTGALTVQVIASAAIPAVCEELLFRGMVFSALERRGTRAALWASSALFALMHGNLFGMPAYLLVGAVSAFVVYTLDSLYAGMLFHTVYNAAILVILYQLSARPEVAAMADTPISPVSVILDAAMVGMMIVATLMTLNLRRRAMGIEPVPRSRAPLPRRDKLMLGAAVVVMVINTLVIQILTEAGL